MQQSVSFAEFEDPSVFSESPFPSHRKVSKKWIFMKFWFGLRTKSIFCCCFALSLLCKAIRNQVGIFSVFPQPPNF